MTEPAHFQSTKSFWNYPCAHRQHRHKGVCALVHGYSRSFHFVFGSSERDSCGFVVDFGQLRWVKEMLDDTFDHTLLLCEDDPLMPQFRELEAAGAAAIRTLPYGVGMEDTAQFVCEWVNNHLVAKSLGRCWVISVEVRENDKNSGRYINPNGKA
jgi:6-pyruvoyltetrahydropterin/6-carboxytetrahydropterin synthase